ncbi:MAG: TlpA family protein disulfide reductase [Planctomycetota bacterium]
MKRMAGLGVGGLVMLAAWAQSAAAGETPAQGDKLINVPLTTLSGKKTSLAKIVKGKVTAFKFGTTWCGWCKKELAEFEKVIDKYGDKVVTLDIDVKEPAAKVKASHKKLNVRTPVVLDPQGKAAAKYDVRGFPTLIVADHKARVLLRSYYVPFAKLEPILDKAVKAAAADKKTGGS